MMAAVFSSNSGRRGQTWPAILILLVLTILGALHVNILGQTISLSFLPLAGICLWPRNSNPLVSIIAIFIFGILLDVFTHQILGFRTLIYLTIFAIFRPDSRLKQHIFGTAFMQWVLTILVGFSLFYLLAWIGRGTKPYLMTLWYQGLLALALFPLIYLGRYILRFILVDAEDRY